MTKFKVSSKMHVMIIVSALIVAIGIAVGVVCQFLAGGYFNYGGDYKSYDSIVVSYAYVDFSDEDEVKELCEEVFKESGVTAYADTYGDTTQGGEIVFSFAEGVNADAVRTAAETINARIGESGLSTAFYHTVRTQLGGGKALSLGAVAIAAVAAFQFLYFIVRYKLAMALSALLADVHNLAIFVSLLTITRIPVGSAVIAFAAITELLTMIGCCFLFDRVRKNMKKDSFNSLDVTEQTDVCADESLFNVSASSVFIAAAAAVIFVLLSISALSVSVIATPVVCALFAAVSCVYGTLFFTPSVYSRFKRIGDNFKAKHTGKPAAASVKAKTEVE